MTIDVVIPTYRPEGIERTAKMSLPRVDGVRYIVSWQAHGGYPLPSGLDRDDVEVYRIEGKGLSANRNNAISKSKAEIIYLADDDIVFKPDIFDNIRKRFAQYPDTELATFRMLEGRGKSYPDDVVDIGFYLPKNYSVGSCEMAFRRANLQSIRFNESFGINSGRFASGEDELFHLTARKRGFKCRYFPDVIASHPHESTGERKITNKFVTQGMGAIIAKSYPNSFPLRIPLKAYRMHKSGQAGFLHSLIHLSIGSLKSLKISI